MNWKKNDILVGQERAAALLAKWQEIYFTTWMIYILGKMLKAS